MALAASLVTVGAFQLAAIPTVPAVTDEVGGTEAVSDALQAEFLRRGLAGLSAGAIVLVIYALAYGVKSALEPRMLAAAVVLFVPLFFVAGWGLDTVVEAIR